MKWNYALVWAGGLFSIQNLNIMTNDDLVMQVQETGRKIYLFIYLFVYTQKMGNST